MSLTVGFHSFNIPEKLLYTVQGFNFMAAYIQYFINQTYELVFDFTKMSTVN